MLVSWVQIKQRKKSFLLLKYPLKRAHFISRLCRGIRAPMRIQIYNCMKEEIYAGKWTASECDWDTGFPEFTFGSGYSAWFVSKLDVLGAEGYLPVWKAEINWGLHPMHYASQWKGPTDNGCYINRRAQMGLLVETVRFLWVTGFLQIMFSVESVSD